MAKKNTAEVLINGKIYVISGYESTAYLQKVAAYLNEMEEKVTAMDGYRELENRDKEIYGLKHDLIDAKLEQEKLTKRIHELETELAEEQKMKARLSQSAAGRKIHRPEQKL